MVLRSRIALLALFLGVGCGRHASAPALPDRVAGWRSDLAFLRAEVLRRHPPPDDDPAFATFSSELAKLNDVVPRSSDEVIGTTLQRILAGLGDGHTSIIPEDEGVLALEALMVDFYWFDDGVHIASVRPGLGRYSGARVTSVGGMPIEQFLQRLAPYVPRDNEMSLRWLSAQLMQYSALSRAASGTTAATIRLGLVDASGAAIEADIPAHNRAALPRLHPPGGLGPQTPRYLQHPSHAYWIDSLPDDSLVYVNFNAVRDDSAETLAQFSTRLAAVAGSGRFPSMILDLRLNNGGNNTLLPPLQLAIRTFLDASPRHHLVVLIGRATFSAGQNFANWLDRNTNAVFVGEPTGSRPNFLGDGSDTPLPYSGLRVSIAGRRYDDSTPDDRRPWIAPDVAVPVLATDYFANRDPAFDAALANLRSSRVGDD